MASSDRSSKWVSFGDEEATETARTTAQTRKARSRRVSSSFFDDWPLNELSNDIEQQKQRNQQPKNDVTVIMEKQMEDIELVLSDARGRLARSKRLQAQSSHLALSLRKKNTFYQSMVDDDDENHPQSRSHLDANRRQNKSEKSHIESVLRDLDRESQSKRRDTYHYGNSFPNPTRAVATTISANTEKKPRKSSILCTSNRDVALKRETDDGSFPIRLPTMVPPSQVENSNPKHSSRVASQPMPPTRINRHPHQNRNTNYTNTSKDSRSSLTFETFDDSQESSSEEEASYKRNYKRAKILKLFLITWAIVVVIAIGFLVGQWAQETQRSKSGQPMQQQQQQQQQEAPTVSPVILVPTNSDNSDTPSRTTDANLHDITEEEEKEKDENSPAKNPVVSEESTDLESNEKESTSQPIGYDYTANSDFLVGVYYYPWHNNNFHNGGGYMRKELTPKHVPALGEYNDSDPGVISHHMKWFRQANIGLLVTSWWGPNRHEDQVTKDVIMEHKDVGNLKIALHYETTGRIGKQGEKLTNAMPDIKYMCENYFDHSNYYKIDGRPVLFIYISRHLHTVGILEEALLTMRSTGSKCGHNLYLVGDSVFNTAPDPDTPHFPFWYFDAVTNYDVYGSSGRPEGHAGTDAVDDYYRNQAEWKAQALREDCRYVPAVSPGYNDRGVRMESDHPPLSRRITSTSKEGSLFHYQLKQAKELVDAEVDNMILVNSFNEWHEDTQIEPVVGDPATQPFNFTKGLEYVGYGELYLDILGAATSKETRQHKKYDYLF